MATFGSSQENLIKSEVSHNTREENDDTGFPQVDDLAALTAEEKRFLLLVERGDVANVKRLIDTYRDQPEVLLIDCVDPLGRSALTVAIENENYELIQLLLDEGIKVKDALLHAIKEEYVEAVELLLEWEEQHHQPGTPYSWEAADRDTATFTPDITPLILAAHKNNYEIIKILLDRGASLPLPHDVKCGCDACVTAVAQDSLRYSRARINAYRALASPSLICLSSKDPFLTAFELSWELRRLAKVEAEFRAEYNELRTQCQEFATTLLGHARTSVELQTLLNHQATRAADQGWEPGEKKQSLERLKLAIKYKQKRFVAHPSVQQLLASMWYEGLPGFRRKTLAAQLIDVAKLGAMFPIYCLHYMLNPDGDKGKFLKKPFVKFICHSSSYIAFLILLAAASQRVEFVIMDWLGNEWMQEILHEWERKERGALPGIVETAIIIYIQGWIWAEIKSLWSDGLAEYISDLWNVVDFITNTLYVTWIALRGTAVFCVMRESWEGKDPYYPRESWDAFDPMLLSEGMFGAAMIFSFLKLVHIFSINPHLGPLQISLGRMIMDILKFFFIYTLVLFAFGCGLNQLLRYYADLEKVKCYQALEGNQANNFDVGDSCFIWRRFANLFETSQSLFWASFGLVELDAFELTGIKSFTRFWGMLMFGSYSVINVIVLLNMLIAMMSTSYQIISERSDIEWKFARSKLWISYFDEGATVPAPFNILPTFKTLKGCLGCGNKLDRKPSGKRGALQRYLHVSRLLVRRYVSAEENRKQDGAGITEDDVNEIRQDISSFRYELLDVLKTNGMRTPTLQPGGAIVAGRKGKVMERRLMKDFQIGVIETAVKEAILASSNTKDMFARIARAISGKKEKRDWNELVRKASVKADPIGSKQASLKRRRKASAQRRRIVQENPALFSMDPDQLAEYNPKLQEFSAATRVAYAKFKTNMLMSQIKEREDDDSSEPGSPEEQPETATRSQKSRKIDKGASLGDQQVERLQQGEDATSQSSSTLDESTPILGVIQTEIEKSNGSRESPQRPHLNAGDDKEKAEDYEIPAKLEQMPEPSDEGKYSSGQKAGFTVVQIETRQSNDEDDISITRSDKEPEDQTGEKSEWKDADKKKADVMIVTSTSSQQGDDALKRTVFVASGSSLPPPLSPQPLSSPSRTGKSAVTGQLRTGWI